jgi:pyocin large subunit-like protein
MFISVEAVRWVFTQSKSERSARLVLLAIATHCNDDGCCWPGMDALMRYTKLSKNTILQARDELVELKELVVETGGRGAGDSNHYYLPKIQIRVQKVPKKGQPI